MDKCIIRKAISSDIKNIFELSNSNYVRENSIHPNPISWDEHITWFSNILYSKKHFFYIIETNKNEFVGQLRLSHTKKNNYLISISIRKEFHKQGYGSNSLKKLFILHNNFNFFAYIKSNNFSSQQLFQKMNFIKISETKKDSETFFLYKHNGIIG